MHFHRSYRLRGISRKRFTERGLRCYLPRMSEFRLYNTLTRSVDVFEPADGQTVRMYTCGPTVYNPAHVGNFRTFLFEDLLRRVLRLRGWNVMQIMNLTDVDDKIIKRAAEAVATGYQRHQGRRARCAGRLHQRERPGFRAMEGRETGG